MATLGKLPKGQVRNNIVLPEGYGKKVTLDGKRVTVKPTIEVSVYKDRWGRYTVKNKGDRLTPAEKRLGLRRSRSQEAQWIKQEYETYGPNTIIRKVKGRESGRLKRWQVNDIKGWAKLTKKNQEFIGEKTPFREGDMERLMRSLDGTTFAWSNGIKFTEMWDKMTADEKFDFMQKTADQDWDQFFKEYIDSDGTWSDTIDLQRQEEGLNMVLALMES